MTKARLILLGLIPTVIVFIFATPWLGLVIGIVEFIILSIIWWLYSIVIQSIVTYFSKKYNTTIEEMSDEVSNSSEYYNHLKKIILKNLMGGKKK